MLLCHIPEEWSPQPLHHENLEMYIFPSSCELREKTNKMHEVFDDGVFRLL